MTGDSQKNGAKEDDKIDVGEALYEISLNLLERSCPDLIYKFIGLCENEDGSPKPDDGIMMTTGGVYREVEDIETGHRFTVFSFDYNKLRGAYDETGYIRPAGNASNMDGVYPVPETFRKKPAWEAGNDNNDGAQAFQPIMQYRGGTKRLEISQHFYRLQSLFKEELSLFGADLTGLFNAKADEDAPDPKVYKFGNTRLSYGIYETEAGKWELRRRIREKQDDEERLGSVLKLDRAGSGKFLDKLLSDGDNMGTFDSKADAMSAMVLDFDKRSVRRWNAQSFLDASEIAQAPVSHAKRSIMQQTLDFLRNRSAGEFLSVIVMGAASTLAFAGQIRAATVGAAALGILYTYANKFFEQVIASSFSGVEKIKFWKNWKGKTGETPESAATENPATVETPPPQTLEDYMDEEIECNKSRVCPRLKKNIGERLRFLTSAESDFKPEDLPYSTPPGHEEDNATEAWVKLELQSLQNSAFKAVATPLDTRTMSHYYLMGIVAVSHTHTDYSRSIYVMARPDMKVSEESFIRPDIHNYLGDGKVLHIYQKPGAQASLEAMSVDDMVEEVKGFLHTASGHPHEHTAHAVAHIEWLFGGGGEEHGPSNEAELLSEIYWNTPGRKNGITSMWNRQAPQTLPEANPTPEQIQGYIDAKRAMRQEFMVKRRLTGAMERANHPGFSTVIQQMGL